MNNQPVLLSEYFGDANGRHAEVIRRADSGYSVNMYLNDRLIESRIIDNHSLQYVEDCAENWATGIISCEID